MDGLCANARKRMAQIRAQQKRSLLQWIYDSVVTTNPNGVPLLVDRLGIVLAAGESSPITDLQSGLMWFQGYLMNDLSSGKLIVGSSGYQHQTKYAEPAVWRAFTQEALMELAQEFREIYNDAVVTLTTNSCSINDINILRTMMADDRLQTVTKLQSDYTLIRMPWTRLG